MIHRIHHKALNRKATLPTRWVAIAAGLLSLAACGDPSRNLPDSGQAIPAAGTPAGQNADAMTRGNEGGVAERSSLAVTGLQRSPVAAGTYRIEAGNPIPVPASAIAVPRAATQPGSVTPTQALATPFSPIGNEIVVQPGLPSPSTAGMAGPAAHGLRR